MSCDEGQRPFEVTRGQTLKNLAMEHSFSQWETLMTLIFGIMILYSLLYKLFILYLVEVIDHLVTIDENLASAISQATLTISYLVCGCSTFSRWSLGLLVYCRSMVNSSEVKLCAHGISIRKG